MRTSTIVWIIVIIVIIGGGIYWFSTQNASAPSTVSQATTTAPSATPTLSVASNAQFPSYLTAGNGMALYTYNKDTSGVSNCSGSCATAWPPYTVASASDLSAGAGVTGSVGTITRSDGTLQVTYNGMPLYFFVQDTGAGEVTGNGQNGFSVAMAAASQAQTQAQTQTTVKTRTTTSVSDQPTTPAPTTPAPAQTSPAPYTAPSYNY